MNIGLPISWDIIEGDEKGQKIALVTESIITKFFSIGVKNVQNECNKVASKYRTMWSAKTSHLMSEYHLLITYAEGCKELLPDFALFEPHMIHSKILDCYYQPNTYTAATTAYSINDPMNPVLTIYLKILEANDSTIIWTGFSDSFESIINHELLHCCGDSPLLNRDIYDGVIRHTMVGNEAISNLSS